MSRSSQYLAGKKSRHGTQTEKKRMRTAFILTKRTEAVAKLVADKLKALVREEVSNELDRRGIDNSPVEGGESDQQAGGQVPVNGDASEVVYDQADTSPNAEERPSGQAESPGCPVCGDGLFFAAAERGVPEYYYCGCGYDRKT